MWVFLGGRILRKNLGIKSIKTNSWNQWRPIPGMQLHKYSKVHLNMHVTLRYAPNFIHKEKNIWKNIWLSASPEGYVSDPLTSTGMRLLQTWMCFCFENLQGKIFQDCSKDPVEGSNKLKKTLLTSLCDQILWNRRFNAFSKSVQNAFYLLALILDIFSVVIYTIHLNELTVIPQGSVQGPALLNSIFSSVGNGIAPSASLLLAPSCVIWPTC